MRYKIFENGAEINTIVADEVFVPTYCENHGYTFEESPIPSPEPELESDPAPTELDRLEAQVVYTAMMTDTLLEEG